jgi:methyl-accepting chemotaxis protein
MKSLTGLASGGILKQKDADKSVADRLNGESRISVIIAAVVLAIALIGGIFSITISASNQSIGGTTLKVAVLEKDFAAVERDLFKALTNPTDEANKVVEKGIASFLQDKSGLAKQGSLANDENMKAIEQGFPAYANQVRSMIANPIISPDDIAKVIKQGDALNKHIVALRTPLIEQSHSYAKLQVLVIIGTMVLILLSIVAMAVRVVVGGRKVSASVAGDLAGSVHAIDAIAAGELDEAIPGADRTDEFGDLARAAIALRDTSRAKRESDQAVSLAIEVVGEGLQALARGDLSFQLRTLPDAYQTIERDYLSASSQLREIVSAVSTNSESIRTGAAEISQASDDLSRRTEQQAASLEEAAAAMDQITTSIRDTAAGANDVRQSVTDTQSAAEVGGDVVRQAIGAMGGIEKSSQEIAQIINVIDSIAFQTNLLALNAGVEAARAGDAGKGFAVVANEVRALAQRTSDAAKDIKGLITASTEQVQSGVRLVGETGNALESIVTKVSSIAGLIQQISAATEEQSQSISQVNAVVGDMDKMTQQNAAMVEESNAAARSLLAEADELGELVQNFELGKGVVRSSNTAAKAAAPAARPGRGRPITNPVVRGNLAMANQAEEDWTEF